MSGRLFTIVGPSGCGKDSLLDGLRQRAPLIKIVKRYITRPADSGGEDHHYLCPRTFERHTDDGHFLFTWNAHGLSYGIPISCLDLLREGHDVVFNGSRAVLDTMQEIYPDLNVIWIDVSPHILADRLRRRGREDEDRIQQRLMRDAPKPPAGVMVVNNDGLLDQAVSALVTCFTSPAADVQ